jgi:hypothetical protein
MSGLPSGPSIPISAYSKFSSCILLISLIISFEGLVSNPYYGIELEPMSRRLFRFFYYFRSLKATSVLQQA